MPNYCFGTITPSTEEGRKKLEQLTNQIDNERFSGKGKNLAEIVLPMPDNIYQGALGQKEREIHGTNNWYDWSIENYGNKWGDFDGEFSDGSYRFATAWSPFDLNFLEVLHKEIGDFDYSFEEEQGWGGEITAKDGVVYQTDEWDIPLFTSLEDFDFYQDLAEEDKGILEENSIFYLSGYYRGGEEHTGFYRYYSVHDKIGDTEQDVLDFISNEKS